MRFLPTFCLLGLALAGGAERVQTLAPPPEALQPVRDLQLAADREGRLVLALITDAGRATSGRGTFTARTVSAWRWNSGAWQPLGGVLNYDRPRPAANLNLALGAGGTPLLAWNENSGDNDVVVFRAWRGGAWTDWRTRYLGISSPQSAKTRALAAWQDEPVLVWGENPRQGPGTVLTLRRWQGGAWVRSTPLNGAGTSGRQPSLALDRRGGVTAAWLEGDVTASRVVVARLAGDRWTRLGAAPGGRAPTYLAAPRLALGRQGRPTVAWLEDVDGRDTLFVSRWDGGRWTALGGAVSLGFASAPSLVLDGAGRPVLAWVEERGGVGQVRLARWTDTAWQDLGTVNRDPGRDARSPSVAVDAPGNVVLAWREDTRGVYRVHLRRFTP
ncbi:hypothetical protein [Deinococcus aestuarii]|uniref:hypothetical protein n=1 Tax=Deinococcus aestuarii TaxID=2774531 RepID=UPI001C0E25D9|nr:hypothetical protein [Deinococcus aestuarii]